MRQLVQYRTLIFEMAKREIGRQHSGQMLGAAWSIVHSLFLIALYVFIFAVVFKIKIGGTHELPLDYTTYLLAGLIPWMSFQEAMMKSCADITGSAQIVRQVVFPLEILPARTVAAALVTQIVATAALLAYVALKHGGLPWTYSLLPVLMLAQILAMAGVAYALAAVSVFVRDTREVVRLFALSGAYLMPVFYLPEWTPRLFQPLLYLNPFSYMAWAYQDALYFGRFDHPWAWVVFIAGSLLTFVFGYRAFRKLSPMFGNVL
jgi:lipopolysaccharide transport system permease protein